MANEIEKKEFINTPFSYTKTQAGLTLLQQNIMIRVSAHMQNYIKAFWKNPNLVASKERPKPVMTKEQLAAMPPMRLEFSEIGISASTYARAKEALDEIIHVEAERDTINEQGIPVKRRYPVFSMMEIPMREKTTTVKKNVYVIDEETGESINVGKEDREVSRMMGYVDLTLNKDMVLAVFDMTNYVSHQENIARIGKVANMPMMYYLIRHKMNNFRDGVTQAKIELKEVRDYLKVDRYDETGKLIKSSYPAYSVFKQRVLKTALDEMQKLYDIGKMDVYFTMTEIRRYGKKTGSPSYLVFELHKRDDVPRKSSAPVQTTLFEDTLYVPEDDIKKYDKDKYRQEWIDTVSEYNGILKDVLKRGVYKGCEIGAYPVVDFDKEDFDFIDAHTDDWQKVQDIMKSKTHLYGHTGVRKGVKDVKDK